jgi:hypothetical protein
VDADVVDGDVTYTMLVQDRKGALEVAFTRVIDAPVSDTPFLRSNEAARVIYGFRDGTFFRDTYEEDVEAFDAAFLQARDSGIPFNRTAPN